VTIDKCAVPDVDPTTIHFKDTSCFASEESSTTWKLTTSFSDCGSNFEFSDEKLMLQNTLSIGHSIVSGIRISRKYDIAFSCRFNLDAQTSSSTLRANDVKFDDVTFDINDGQPSDFSFEFDLDFFKSEDFLNVVSDGSFQPGSPLFVKVSPTNALPEALTFSVNKCTAEDLALSQSLNILETCPTVPGIGFQFFQGQSDHTSVTFSYTTFLFEASEDTAEIQLSCDLKICPKNSLECLKLCDTSNSDSNINIMVIPSTSVGDSYVINGDGSTKSAVQINTPNDVHDYTKYARSAVVADQLYIFGGDVDSHKIARLDACEIVQLSVRLNHEFHHGHGVLAIENGSKALICFGNDHPHTYCYVFDGLNVDTTHSSVYSHNRGGFAFYNGQPTTVGGILSDGHRKVETLTKNGWQELADFSENLSNHNLVGLANGDMLLIGGQVNSGDESFQNSIWRLGAVSGTWTEDVALQKAYSGSAILVDNAIYSFGINGGAEDEGPIQRIDLNNDFTIEKIELIGYQRNDFLWPILHVVDTNADCFSTTTTTTTT